MVRFRAISLVLAALAVGLGLAACGGGSDAKLLPGKTADQINSNLDLVRESVNEGNCEEAEDAVAQVSTQVDELGNVDKGLKSALRQGAAKLSEVVATCGAAAEAEEAKAAEKEEEEGEAEALEAAEAEAEETEAFEEEEQKEEEREQKAEEKAQEKAEEEAEEPEPPTGGEESPKGKAKGHEKQEEIEPPTPEEPVTPPEPGSGGPGGGIGPGAAVEGGP
jgi:polyribonucleotide nucleotidyltransferase